MEDAWWGKELPGWVRVSPPAMEGAGGAHKWRGREASEIAEEDASRVCMVRPIHRTPYP